MAREHRGTATPRAPPTPYRPMEFLGYPAVYQSDLDLFAVNEGVSNWTIANPIGTLSGEGAESLLGAHSRHRICPPFHH